MRTFNRLLSLLLAVVLLGGGLLVALNGALAALGMRPWPVRTDQWYRPLTTTHLGDTAVLAASIGLAVLGLILLIAELRPWAPAQLSMAVPGEEGRDQWWIQRRSVEHHLAAAANSVTGVEHAQARLRGRRRRWRLLLSARGRADACGEVEQAVRTELARLAAPETAQLRVSMREPKRVT